MSKMLPLTLGLDPEFFLVDSKGTPVSAHDIVPGTKLEPHKLKHCSVQADGTAVEFNTKPTKGRLTFARNIQDALDDLRGIIPKKYKFHFEPHVVYPKEYFDALPDYAKILGCDPDYNALNHGARNKRPDGDATTMRTGSAHIHFGWREDADVRDPGHIWDCCQVVKNVDRVFQSVKFAWDRDTEREKLYGKPGAFRPKHYGVEYRSLSNAWLNHPELWTWIFDVCKNVFDRTVEGEEIRIQQYYGKYKEHYAGGPVQPTELPERHVEGHGWYQVLDYSQYDMEKKHPWGGYQYKTKDWYTYTYKLPDEIREDINKNLAKASIPLMPEAFQPI